MVQKWAERILRKSYDPKLTLAGFGGFLSFRKSENRKKVQMCPFFQTHLTNLHREGPHQTFQISMTNIQSIYNSFG